MSITASVRSATSALLATALVTFCVSSADAQSVDRGAKLDSILRERARHLAGRSRIIVQFKGEPDVRVFGNGLAGRRLRNRAQVGEVDNRTLAQVASDPR